MIGRIKGFVIEKQPPIVLVETNGIGYEINMPITCFEFLPEIGQESTIFTHFMVRDEIPMLFGFIDFHEKILFRGLIQVNGIGPKLALAILSTISGKQLISAIENLEMNLLIKLPGVGKKIAERLIMKMKDKYKLLYSEINSSIINSYIPKKEAIAALVSLGYKYKEANSMVDHVAHAGADCEALIIEALRYSMR